MTKETKEKTLEMLNKTIEERKIMRKVHGKGKCRGEERGKKTGNGGRK
jgi:hypothetical protein